MLMWGKGTKVCLLTLILMGVGSSYKGGVGSDINGESSEINGGSRKKVLSGSDHEGEMLTKHVFLVVMLTGKSEQNQCASTLRLINYNLCVIQGIIYGKVNLREYY